MANKSWFANSGSLQIWVSGATLSTVAALKNVTMTPKFEIAVLRGMETLKPQARCKHSFTVDVKCEYAMWDPTADTIMSSFLQGSYSSAGTGIDDTAGFRNMCATFDITATVYDTTRASIMTLKALAVVFPEIPMEMRENEYVSRNLAGEGNDFTIAYTSA